MDDAFLRRPAVQKITRLEPWENNAEAFHCRVAKAPYGLPQAMSQPVPGKRHLDLCFHRTQVALALVKQHHREGQRLKLKSQDLLLGLQQQKKREADLLKKIEARQREEGLDCDNPRSQLPARGEGLEYELSQVRRLIKRGMASLDEQNERLETHLRTQRALYEQILDEGGVIEKEDVCESLWQNEEVQHEMKSLSEDMARLDKLMQDFHGISDAALLSRHASLERSRVSVAGNGPQDSVRSEGSALPGHAGHVARSDVGLPPQRPGVRRSGFFQRTPRKVNRPADAAPRQVDETPPEDESPPLSRKRQRSLILAEMERLQSEAKKLERDAEDSEVLVEVVTTLSQSKEELAAHERFDVESIFNSFSENVSGESNVGNGASTTGTPPEPVVVASGATPSPDVLQVAEPEGLTSCEADELGYDWVLPAELTETPSEVVTTDSLDRGGERSVAKKIDFGHVDLSVTCDARSSSSSVTCVTEHDIAAACEEDGVESENKNDDGATSRQNTTAEHLEETASIEEEFDCEPVTSNSDDHDDEDNSVTFSESMTATDDEDSNSVELLDSDPEVPSPARSFERALSPQLSDHCSGNEQEDVRDCEGDSSQHLDDDQMKEMRQSLDWFQENLRQEEDHRQAAEQQSAQLSDLCVGQAMQLEVLREERDALENRRKELHVDMDSRFEVQHQEGQEVEATAAASDNWTLEDLKPDLKGNEASKSRLLEEQKQVLGDQLKEGERLRCSLESKVHALRRQVEQLELSRQIAEEMGEMICYQNRAWRLALRLTIQSCFYFLAVYVWLKNFHSEVAVPLPT